MKPAFIFLLLFLMTSAIRAQVTFNVVTPPCNNNGIITATASALTPPLDFTYNWMYNGSLVTVTHSNVATMSDNLTGYSGQGLYVTVVSTSSSQQEFGTFSQPPFNITTSSTPEVCPTLGTATATVSGGAMPYTYQWQNTSGLIMGTTSTVNVPSGQYDVIVTDNNGCVFSTLYSDSNITMPGSVFVQYTSSINLLTSSTMANCTNGTATVNATGGTAPYTYAWSNGASTQTITGLITGNYLVTVTDGIGCTAFNDVYVSQSITINVNSVPTPATCVQNNGSAIAFGAGGMPPYTYLWGNGANTQSITNLNSGYIPVVVTDANGCIGNGGAFVSSTTPINVTYSTTPSSCTTPNGSATLSITGGTLPYTTVWNTFPAQTGIVASNLSVGEYDFQITDAVGCVQSGYIKIDELNPMTINLSSSPALCVLSNGSASVNVTGGSAPYTYSWSNGSTSSSISSVASNWYSVSITDNTGCVKNKSVFVDKNSPLFLANSVTPASCIYTNDGSATVSVFGGTIPYTYNWSSGSSTATTSSLGQGYYYISVSDANGCTANDWIYVPYNSSNNSCYCTVQGNVYIDANNNCIKDAGEIPLNNAAINCSGFGTAYTNSLGDYSFIVPAGTYTLSEIVQTFYPLSSCQSNNIVVASTPSAGCTITNDFANGVTPIHDMKVNLWDINFPVPGNTYTQKLIVANMGTLNESAIEVGYKNDGQLNAVSSLVSSVPLASTIANWYTTSGSTSYAMNTGVSEDAWISYNVPTNIPMGTNLNYNDSTAYMAPIATNWLSDYTPWNNVNAHSSIVVSSYDPNFKAVQPRGIGTKGLIELKDSVLDYQVHFQNEGTYYAQNVVVLDTLDSDLDWTSLRPVYQSHNCKISISQNGVAKFEFPNINLWPKAWDEMLSQGMFTYTIKQKKNLALGTEIKNSAAIYFDYNAPVITNTTVNTIYDPLEIGNIKKLNSLKIYPNPSSNSISIDLADASKSPKLTIFNIEGKVVYTNEYSNVKTINIDITSFVNGNYFVQLSNDKSVNTGKFVKID